MMFRKLVATGAVFLLLLFGEAQGLVQPTSFEDAEGLRIVQQQQFKEDVKRLQEDFKRYGIVVETSTGNEYNAQYQASRAIVNAYKDRESLPWYYEKQEFRKALRAVLKLQEADILVLSQYKLLERRDRMWLEEAEAIVKGRSIADSKADLDRAEEIWRTIQELSRKSLDEDNESVGIEQLQQEVVHRDKILVLLRDYRALVVKVAETLRNTLEVQGDQYMEAKIEWEGILSLLENTLRESQSLVERLDQGLEAYSVYNAVYMELVEQKREAEEHAGQGRFIEAVEKGRAILQSAEALNSKVSSEIKRIMEQEEREKAEEKARKSKRNAVLLFAFAVMTCAIPVSLKVRELIRVDPDLRTQVARELVKTGLIVATFLIVTAVLISLFVGPFPFSFFLAVPRAPRARAVNINKGIQGISVNLIGIPFQLSRCSATVMQLFSELHFPRDMIKIVNESLPARQPTSTLPERMPSQDQNLLVEPGSQPVLVPLSPLVSSTPGNDDKPFFHCYEAPVTMDVLDSMAAHALAALPAESYGTIYSDEDGVIRKYHPIDDQNYTLRSYNSVNFTKEFYRHVKWLSDIYRSFGFRLAGDSHSHYDGSSEQSHQDVVFNRSFWRTRRNTSFVIAINTGGNGDSSWRVYGDFEVRRKVGRYAIRIRAYGIDEPKKIIIV